MKRRSESKSEVVEARAASQSHEAGREGSVSAEAWMPLVYECLRELAERWFRNERQGHTLQPTALVHEAYLRLLEGRHTGWRDQVHFFSTAARVMRRVLVDHARRRAAQKRGGDRQRVLLDEVPARAAGGFVDILALDDALTRLEADHERPSRVVELRYFSGLTIDETAQALGVSARTVDLDWRFARAWLLRELEIGAA